MLFETYVPTSELIADFNKPDMRPHDRAHILREIESNQLCGHDDDRVIIPEVWENGADDDGEFFRARAVASVAIWDSMDQVGRINARLRFAFFGEGENA